MFRHYSSLAFDVRTPFALRDFEDHVARLVRGGCVEIELAGRVLRYTSQRERMSACVDAIHAAGARAVLYSSAFGAETRARYRGYAQRSASGEPLGYLGSARSLMMCPRSPYVEIAARETGEAVAAYGFDKVFVDIPWILKGGCWCEHCAPDRAAGQARDQLIQSGLERYRALVRGHAEVPIGANVGAPTIHREGPRPDALVGVVDEIVTEWNPLRWGGRVDAVRRCISDARAQLDAPIYHATTCTDRRGRPIAAERLASLFSTIRAGGAIPRVGVGVALVPHVIEASRASADGATAALEREP